MFAGTGNLPQGDELARDPGVPPRGTHLRGGQGDHPQVCTTGRRPWSLPAAWQQFSPTADSSDPKNTAKRGSGASHPRKISAPPA